MALGLQAPRAAADLLCTLALGPGKSPDPEQHRQAEALAEELGCLPPALLGDTHPDTLIGRDTCQHRGRSAAMSSGRCPSLFR